LELETQLIICRELGFLSNQDLEGVLSEVNQLSRMLATLIAKLG